MTQLVYKKQFPSWSTYSTQENAVKLYQDLISS